MQHTKVCSKGRFVFITLALLLGIFVTSGIVWAQSAIQQPKVSIKPEITGQDSSASTRNSGKGPYLYGGL